MNLIKVIKDLRSDLFYQIESKVGAEKARQYPSIKLADDVLKNMESSSRIMQESDSERLLADYHKWLDMYKFTEMSPQNAAKEYLRRKSANGA